MRILNRREGFACNSSSTHSIIFTDGSLPDVDANGSFGWEYFTAASERAKKLWLAISLRTNMREFDEANAGAIIEKITGLKPEDFRDGYVDHQSLIEFPRAWSGVGLDIQFAEDFHRYLMNPRAVIYGGNDNESDPPTAPSGEVVNYRSWLLTDGGRGTSVARKDSAGYWTIFSREYGEKVRVAFDETDLGIEARRADAPELVDLKITDFCTYDCEACYQGSTREGRHGDYYKVVGVLQALGAARCFEVAIGGGEPTLHPKFSEIVREARRNGIVPNFTTRDPRWFLRHMDVVGDIGAVAVSCDTHEQMQKAVDAVEALPKAEREVLEKKLVVQHILGIADEWQVQSLLRGCRDKDVSCVLLGYKTTHRGANVKPRVPNKKGQTWGQWIAQLNEAKDHVLPYRLGVDTVLAAEFKGLVPEYRLTTREGQFSCYIDASGEQVKMYPSSFGADKPLEPNMAVEDSLITAWRKLTSYTPQGAYVYKRSLGVV